MNEDKDEHRKFSFGHRSLSFRVSERKAASG